MAAADHSSAAAVAVRADGEACFGVAKQQQRREAQGRSVGGEGLEMISAVNRDADGGGGNGEVAAPSASCAKGKEERKGKSVVRGWKRERDRERDAPSARTRKEKPADGSSPPPPPSVFLPSSALPAPEHHLCGPGHCLCAAPDSRLPGDTGNVNNNNNSNGAAGKTALECGVKSGAIVVRRQQDDTPAAKKHRGAEKVRPAHCVEANKGR